jgi:transcriptional regulator with XRE-family HTH domain
MQIRELTGLSKSTISDLENDKSSPTAETLQKIAAALGVKVDEFFNFSGIKEAVSPKVLEVGEPFENVEDALKFILSQPSLMAYGGYDPRQLNDEEILEIANDMLFALRLSLEKIKRKKNK